MSERTILDASGTPIRTRSIRTIRELLIDVARNLQAPSPLETELRDCRLTGTRRSVAVGLCWDEATEQVAVFLVDIAPRGDA